MTEIRNSIFGTLALFTSFSTLICCALPALLVTIGAGATLVGLTASFPQLVWLSEHKIGLFSFAGAMLTASAFLRYQTRNAPCPADPTQAMTCKKTRRVSGIILACSSTIYAIGFFFAFIAVYFV